MIGELSRKEPIVLALKVAAFFKRDPIKYLRMPLAKIIFLSDGIRVLTGEVVPERLLNKEDKEIMDYMKDHKDDLIADINQLIQEEDNKEVQSLYEQ